MRIVSLLFHDVFVRDPAESGFVSPAADRYKLSRADFDAQLDGLLRASPEADCAQLSTSDPQLSTTEDIGDTEAFTGKMLDRQSALLCPRVLRVLRGGEVGSLPFLITVDDGGVSYHTVVADRLEELGWRGHCFVTTDRIGQKGFLSPTQIRELDARGHVIGTHSASHPARFSACAVAEMLKEWSVVRARTKRANSRWRRRLFAPICVISIRFWSVLPGAIPPCFVNAVSGFRIAYVLSR